jgi:hypothetical protein
MGGDMMKSIFAGAAWCVLVGSIVGCASTRQAATPTQASTAPPAERLSASALSRTLLKSEAALTSALAVNRGVEASLADVYENVQLLCKAKFDDLEEDHERYAKAEARTNVLGSLVALIGSVTGYAPGKTVLMGIGISSSNSGTVSSGITQFFSNKAAADKTTLVIVRSQLESALDRYDLINAPTDPQGVRRRSILARAKGICMGLSPVAPQGAAPSASAASGAS